MSETQQIARRPGAPPKNKNAVRLNPKVRAAVAHIIANPEATNEQACAAAGCPERTFYKAKKSSAFEDHFRSLGRDSIRTRLIAKALHRYEGLIDAESEYVAADISKDVLAQAGVRDRVDGARQPGGAGSITIYIGSKPDTPTLAVVVDGTAQRLEDERTD